MNSVKVSVSGKNATCSVFIPCSQSQKEEAERLEYEIKNSLTSSEEESDEEEFDEEAEKDEVEQFLDDTGMSKSYFNSFNSPSDEVRELKAKICRLEFERDDLKEANEELEKENKLLKNERDTLKGDSKIYQQSIRKMYETIDKLTERFNKKNNEVKELKNSFSRCGGCCETMPNCICYIKGDEQIDDDIYHVKGQISELRNRSHLDFPISGYGIEPKLKTRWTHIHFNDAHKEAKELAIKKEQAKYNKLIESNKQYKIKIREQNKAEEALKNVSL
jgi:chromosome segregation ATPase